MEKILISVKDKDKAKLLLELLLSLDFILSVDTYSQETEQITASSQQSDDFFALAGLWEGREINLTSIRQQAWPHQS